MSNATREIQNLPDTVINRNELLDMSGVGGDTRTDRHTIATEINMYKNKMNYCNRLFSQSKYFLYKIIISL